jgi:hypothetical protein
MESRYNDLTIKKPHVVNLQTKSSGCVKRLAIINRQTKRSYLATLFPLNALLKKPQMTVIHGNLLEKTVCDEFSM